MKLLTSISKKKTQFHGHSRGINGDDAFEKFLFVIFTKRCFKNISEIKITHKKF